MKAFFAVHKDGLVVRTGRVTVAIVPWQAVNPGEVSVRIDAAYAPEELYIDDGVVRRVSDDASVVVE